jgi:hypothetical protein
MSGEGTESLCVAFMAIVDLALASGADPLNKHTACWEHQIDDRWWVAVNGHAEPKLSSHSNIPVNPFEAYVEYNGWPAFVLNPYGGHGAAGSLANEDTLIAALKAATSMLTDA